MDKGEFNFNMNRGLSEQDNCITYEDLVGNNYDEPISTMDTIPHPERLQPEGEEEEDKSKDDYDDEEVTRSNSQYPNEVFNEKVDGNDIDNIETPEFINDIIDSNLNEENESKQFNKQLEKNRRFSEVRKNVQAGQQRERICMNGRHGSSQYYNNLSERGKENVRSTPEEPDIRNINQMRNGTRSQVQRPFPLNVSNINVPYISRGFYPFQTPFYVVMSPTRERSHTLPFRGRSPRVVISPRIQRNVLSNITFANSVMVDFVRVLFADFNGLLSKCSNIMHKKDNKPGRVNEGTVLNYQRYLYFNKEGENEIEMLKRVPLAIKSGGIGEMFNTSELKLHSTIVNDKKEKRAFWFPERKMLNEKRPYSYVFTWLTAANKYVAAKKTKGGKSVKKYSLNANRKNKNSDNIKLFCEIGGSQFESEPFKLRSQSWWYRTLHEGRNKTIKFTCGRLSIEWTPKTSQKSAQSPVKSPVKKVLPKKKLKNSSFPKISTPQPPYTPTRTGYGIQLHFTTPQQQLKFPTPQRTPQSNLYRPPVQFQNYPVSTLPVPYIPVPRNRFIKRVSEMSPPKRNSSGLMKVLLNMSESYKEYIYLKFYQIKVIFGNVCKFDSSNLDDEIKVVYQGSNVYELSFPLKKEKFKSGFTDELIPLSVFFKIVQYDQVRFSNHGTEYVRINEFL